MKVKSCIALVLVSILTSVTLAGCYGEVTPTTTRSGSSETTAVTTEAVTEASTEQIEESKPLPADTDPSAYVPKLKDKRVALFSNQSGVIVEGNDTKHVLDLLVEEGVDVTLVFSPEHGFRGDADAGETVSDETDPVTGIPIRSLYGGGGNRPTEGDLAAFDTLVIDIQDVGVRYYTYYLTMADLMDACGAAGKHVIILDRPNPNGSYVDGPILQEEFTSGVGRYPIPVVHGMTLGELAMMINGEGWLSGGKDACDLEVIPCIDYTHESRYELPVPPSPNLRTMEAIYLYPSLCYFENSLMSVGRGTENPFTCYGAPMMEGVEGYTYTFTPTNTGGHEQVYGEQLCYGKDLSGLSEDEILAGQINLDYLITAYEDVKKASPEANLWRGEDGAGHYWVDYLFGTDSVRKMIEEGHTAAEIKESWGPELEAFGKVRESYLLYEE